MKKIHIETLLHRLISGDKDGIVSTLRLAAVDETRGGKSAYAVTLEGFASKLERRSPYDPKTLTVLRPSEKTTASLAAFEERVPVRRLDEIILETENQNHVRRFLDEQASREKLAEHKLAPRSRVLLSGPPGSGKTMLAEVIATETQKPFHVLRMGHLLDSYLGNTIRNIENSFAAIAASDGVFLLDEFDALATARNDKTDVNEMRRALNSLLQCFANHRGSSIVIAATNHPSALDNAFRRRFDAIWTLGGPDPMGRARILTTTFVKHDLPQDEKTILLLQDLLADMSFDECEDAARSLIITAILRGNSAIDPSELDTNQRKNITS